MAIVILSEEEDTLDAVPLLSIPLILRNFRHGDKVSHRTPWYRQVYLLEHEKTRNRRIYPSEQELFKRIYPLEHNITGTDGFTRRNKKKKLLRLLKQLL